jgi:trehalose 6-phosphate phosphatase
MGMSGHDPQAVPPPDRTTLARPLPPPPSRLTCPALFLDLDGVLAPLAPTPEAVVPDPHRTAVLRSLLARLDGRVAIVSGRTLAEIDRISEAALRSASGVHGLERRRDDGTVVVGDAAPAVRTAVSAFEAFAADRPGVIVEDKVVSAGLHFRGAQDQAVAARDLAGRLAADTGLSLQSGNLVVELKTPGTDKGTALTAFMAEAPFAGAVPVMVGDDLTDEHGFEAAAALGGFGVLVGSSRPTAARFGLDDVAAVLDWLDSLTEAPQ